MMWRATDGSLLDILPNKGLDDRFQSLASIPLTSHGAPIGWAPSATSMIFRMPPYCGVPPHHRRYGRQHGPQDHTPRQDCQAETFFFLISEPPFFLEALRHMPCSYVLPHGTISSTTDGFSQRYYQSNVSFTCSARRSPAKTPWKTTTRYSPCHARSAAPHTSRTHSRWG